jgi:hypothetical protein
MQRRGRLRIGPLHGKEGIGLQLPHDAVGFGHQRSGARQVEIKSDFADDRAGAHGAQTNRFAVPGAELGPDLALLDEEKIVCGRK